MQAAIKEPQDTVIVMAHIEKRQSEVLKNLNEFPSAAKKIRIALKPTWPRSPISSMG
jgi:hypothetical protein